MFNFEKLDVWKRGVEMANRVYEMTREFPDAERFGLTSQMRRAAVSIPSNIAEGSSRHSRTDNAHFVEIASGSVSELVTQAFIAKQQGFLSEEDFERLYTEASEQSRMLSGLRAFLLQTKANS
jgi:four helix bundle protein